MLQGVVEYSEKLNALHKLLTTKMTRRACLTLVLPPARRARRCAAAGKACPPVEPAFGKHALLHIALHQGLWGLARHSDKKAARHIAASQSLDITCNKPHTL